MTQLYAKYLHSIWLRGDNKQRIKFIDQLCYCQLHKKNFSIKIANIIR